MATKRKTYFFNRYPKLTLTIIVILISILILFSAEAYLRLTTLQVDWTYDKVLSDRSIRLREYIPGLDKGFTNRNAFKKEFSNQKFYKKKLYITTNEDGFVVCKKYPNHLNPDLSIAFLGGSTTECLVVDDSLRFPFLAKSILEDSLKCKVNVYNAGFSGNNSFHSINAFLNKAVKYKLDYAVQMHNINDLNILLADTNGYFNDIQFRSLIVKNETDNIPFLPIYSILPNFYKLLDDKIHFTEEVNTMPIDKEEWVIKNKHKLISNFSSSLKTFTGICKAWGIKPILMTQPNRFTENYNKNLFFGNTPSGISYPLYVKLYSDFMQCIKNVAASENAMLIDLESQIPKDSTFIYDVVHLTEKGSVLSSKIIVQELLKLRVNSQ